MRVKKKPNKTIVGNKCKNTKESEKMKLFYVYDKII